MRIIFNTAPYFEEEMKSGLMLEKYGELKVIAQNARDIPSILEPLNKNFKTNLSQDGIPFTELEFLIWLSADGENGSNTFQVTLNGRYPCDENNVHIRKALDEIKKHEKLIEEVRITRDCELDYTRGRTAFK